MSSPSTGERRGYPAKVEEYYVDVVPINSIIKLWRTAYLFSVFDSDGQLVGFAPSLAMAELLALKLTAADRQGRINMRIEKVISEKETSQLPPRLRTPEGEERITPTVPPDAIRLHR
ncbi:MAG: hypothetical protein KGL39_45765 [Patescibacteria group bacterium]|nr:hypothetical protein [Patescibacteria group bacterium]